MNQRLFALPPTALRGEDSDQLSTARTGYLSEQAAIAQLLKRGHNVAIPVVDDEGIDLVVNYRTTVQVKSRAAPLSGAYAFGLPGRKRRYNAAGEHVRPRPVPFPDVIMFHARDIDAWWIVTTEQLQALGVTAESQCVSLRPEPKTNSRFTQLSRSTREAWHVFDRP